VLGWVQWRFPRTRPLLQGSPLVVMRDGEVLPAARHQRLSLDDLRSAARQQGIRSLADVELAVQEADGKISFFTRGSGGDSGASGGPEVA
jgi:uncharacterized membrane protein YcaP (DUF421 family)